MDCLKFIVDCYKNKIYYMEFRIGELEVILNRKEQMIVMFQKDLEEVRFMLLYDMN